MNLPFTEEDFFSVFETYNEAIWPAQLVAYTLGLLAVLLAFTQAAYRDRSISAILALSWLWEGLVYHIGFFSAINSAAYLFGALFVLQGFLFIWIGVLRGVLTFYFHLNGRTLFGGVLILYAMLIYPLIGAMLSHGYPKAPMFGVAPCPSTIFTFGLLLWAKSGVPWQVYAIPLIWSLIGFTAAFLLGVKEDYGLLVAAVTGILLFLKGNRRRSQSRANHWSGRKR